MNTQRTYILTEAAALLPLLRPLLVEIREDRALLCSLRTRLERVDLADDTRRRLEERQRAARTRLRLNFREAEGLGVVVTPGVRCEAWIPFEHQWVGPGADDNRRPAYFVFNDAQETLSTWIFAGWPRDRFPINPAWWGVARRPSTDPAVGPAAGPR